MASLHLIIIKCRLFLLHVVEPVVDVVFHLGVVVAFVNFRLVEIAFRIFASLNKIKGFLQGIGEFFEIFLVKENLVFLIEEAVLLIAEAALALGDGSHTLAA